MTTFPAGGTVWSQLRTRLGLREALRVQTLAFWWASFVIREAREPDVQELGREVGITPQRVEQFLVTWKLCLSDRYPTPGALVRERMLDVDQPLRAPGIWAGCG